MTRAALLAALLLLALPAAAQTPLAAPGKPGWTAAGNDCFVWNRSPGKDETATWSGPCVNHRAEGSGALIWRSGSEEQRYDGEMKDGRLNGHGIYVFTYGVQYEGDFKNDDFEGKGIFTQPGVRYEGMWHAGKKNGHGLLTTINGDRYDGAFKDDQITGEGSLTLADGRHYEGTLLDGKPNGKGTMTDPSGTISGTWTNGCLNDPEHKVGLGVDPASCK
jgi:hypothetical protein